MSPEESQLLKALFDRVRQASTTTRDRDAEALINDELRAQPYAAYYLAQAVIMQEKGLEAAAARIQALKGRIKDLEDRAQPQPQSQQQGGFLNSLGFLAAAAPTVFRRQAKAIWVPVGASLHRSPVHGANRHTQPSNRPAAAASWPVR